MATGGKDRGSREARERARLYQARQEFHQGRIARRVRDNLWAGIGGGLAIAAVIVAQTLYFTAGPGMPAPSPTPTSTVSPGPAPSTTTSPDPEPSATPAESPSPTP